MPPRGRGAGVARARGGTGPAPGRVERSGRGAGALPIFSVVQMIGVAGGCLRVCDRFVSVCVPVCTPNLILREHGRWLTPSIKLQPRAHGAIPAIALRLRAGMPPLPGGSSSGADAVHTNKPLVHTSGRPSEGDLTVLVQQPPPPQRRLRPRRSCCCTRRPSPRCIAATAAVLVLFCFHWERPVGDINGSRPCGNQACAGFGRPAFLRHL